MSEVRIRNVRPKPGFVFDGQSVTAIPTHDGLANVITGRGTSVDRSMHNFWMGMSMPAQQIEAAYRSSWLIRQIVDIPAQDETRAGRDWDADDEQIQKIEAEEKRLGYWAKVRQALIYGRLGGGALFIDLGDDPAKPLPTSIKPEQIVKLLPLYRTQLTLGLPDDDVLSPYFDEPVDFRLNTSARPQIHRTRLVFFKGQPVPGFSSVNWEDRFWGDSVVQVVNEAVQNATTATSGFAALIDEAKVDIFKFKNLANTIADPNGGEAKMRKRIDLATTEKSIHRSISLDAEDGWETRTLNFAGAKDMITTLMGIVAGAADIPATRLLGKSPDGLNATGESDSANYFQSVAAQQESGLRPALDQLDAVMLPSAGAPMDLTYKFSPLRVLTEAQQAEIESKEATTLKTLVDTALFSEKALEEAFSNRMVESQRWPGYKEARDADSEGIGAGGDESELGIVPVGAKGGGQQSAGEGGTQEPARRAANDFFADAAPRPLYVQRKLLNGRDLIAWAKANGFKSTLPADDMHVTVLYSRTPVDPMKMGEGWSGDENGHVRIKPGGPRAIERFGDAVVLLFASWEIESRHRSMVEAGGSHDFESYQPHVTISFDVPENFDLETLKPYTGALEFGPELFEPLDLDWKSKVQEN